LAQDAAPRRRNGGRIFLTLAALLLLGAGGAAGWLQYTGQLGPLSTPVPSVEFELPPPGSGSTSTASAATGGDTGTVAAEPAAEPVAAATTTTPEPAVEPAPAATTDETAAAATPTSDAPSTASTASETASIEAAPATEPTAPSEAAPAEPASTDEAAAAAPAPAAASTTSEPAATQAPATASPTETSAEPVPSATAADGQASTGPELASATPPAEPAPALAPPWKRYARPFPVGDTRPRIAIVIAELGLSRAATEAAIERLPPEITLAFNPMAQNLQAWVIKARARGHEVMLDLPMEPLAYPQEDPGPNALLAALGPEENARRLQFLLDRADGYVGVASYMGSRFEGTADLIRPVLQTLAERGLLFLANRSAPATEVPEIAAGFELALISNDRFLDTEATRVAIDGRLQQLERLARTRKGAVAIGLGYPVTIERVGAWTETLGAKGIALAPASALVGVGAP